MPATLTALTFPTADGARAVLDEVKHLSTWNHLKLHDAVILEWPEGAWKPKTAQLTDVESPFAIGGAFAGLLTGLLFAIPLFGAAAGAVAGFGLGKAMRALSTAGLDSEFVSSVRDQVTPGTSALFLLTSDAAIDSVVEALRGTDMRLVATNLSDDEAEQLRDMLDID